MKKSHSSFQGNYKLLNVGCGRTTHPAWINLDAYPVKAGVIVHDVRKPLPFPSNTLDAVYHSHLVEHLLPEDGLTFCSETWRVLRPGGVVRVATPDLESIVRMYLLKLTDASRDLPGASSDYDWILLEMFDQVGREFSGGQMAQHILRERDSMFIASRLGCEAENLACANSMRRSFFERIAEVNFRQWPRLVRVKLACFLAGLVGGSALRHACESGLFRQSGEIHRILYDRYSLARLLGNVGFLNPQQCGSKESRIPFFETFNLDTTPEGKTRKPDSLFMEATKPSTDEV